MNELTLSESLKSYLQAFEEKLQMLHGVGVLEPEARTRAAQETTNKHPLTNEDISLIKNIFLKYVMEKNACTTTEESQERLQEFGRNAETVWQMSDHARLDRDDYEGSQKFAIQAEKYEYQAQEIEYALDTNLINGDKVLVVLNLNKPKVH